MPMASARGSSVFDVLTRSFLYVILQVQHNRANSLEPSNSWSMDTLGAWDPNRDLRQQVIDAVSAFTAPETKLGRLTRTAVMVAGVYVVGRYGKDPALQIVHCSKGVMKAAGTTVRNHLSGVNVSLCRSAAATQQGLDC